MSTQVPSPPKTAASARFDAGADAALADASSEAQTRATRSVRTRSTVGPVCEDGVSACATRGRTTRALHVGEVEDVAVRILQPHALELAEGVNVALTRRLRQIVVVLERDALRPEVVDD